MPARPIANGDLSHNQALELAAADALTSGDFDRAFALADRRCRGGPAPEAHSYVLRAEAAWRLGRKRAALADLGRALAIAPEDRGANRRMLAWGRGTARCRAAAVLASAERDPQVLSAAIGVLFEAGRESVAAVTVLDEVVRGWAAWRPGNPVTLGLAGGESSVWLRLEADPSHPLAREAVEAAAFRLPRPTGSANQVVALSDRSGVILAAAAQANAPGAAAPAAATRPEATGTAVIVPVYADFAATRRCLDILAAELHARPHHRAVIIDDAAPDARMAPYLAGLARHPRIAVLANPQNLGFVASVNRGLAEAGGGDVLLLNADTIPPARFIDRLAEAAHASPDIGLVVPLSNNAELTSFPDPRDANPLPAGKAVAAIDRVAARVNAGRLVDIPAGTGFCLFVRHDCLAALGGRLGAYHRGYLEDIDLCLRARELGYRAVCAPSLYVGHVGTRSFGAEKVALVLRNYRLLEERFPGYAAECEAFAELDPLAPARAAIVAEQTGRRGRVPWA